MADPAAENRADGNPSMRRGEFLAVLGVLGLSLFAVPAYVTFALLGRGDLPWVALPWFDTLVALPMAPGVLLGLIGAWTALRDFRREGALSGDAERAGRE